MEGNCSSSKLKFFQVLLPGFFKKLTIPRAFRKHINGGECMTATLVSSLGKTWYVKILRDTQGMHFGEEGWQEFARAHRLGVGFFLVFGYKGNMEFTVTVFDLSCCKINYKNFQATVKPVIDVDEGNFPKVTEKFGTKHARESKPEVLKSSTYVQPQMSGRKRCPIHFEATMKRSYVSKNPQLNIPVESAEAFKVRRNCKAVLKDSEGKSWHVTVSDKSARTDPRFRPCLRKGWREFVQKNKLVEGDRCIFELESRERGILYIRVLKQ